MESIGIGALAKRAGVRIDTVRYYERSGLLAPRTRLASGYRRYGEVELSRLRFIRRAQALGFTLTEVRDLLASRAICRGAWTKRAAEEKLGDVERKIADLERVRQGLLNLVAACPGQGRAENCPILKALGAEDFQ